MSKNLTRKSVAIGAVVALGTTLFAGAPAFAADVELTPTLGTSYRTLVTESFSLETIFTSAAKQGTENVKFIVTDASKKLDVTSGSYVDDSDGDTTQDGYLNDTDSTVNRTAADGIYVVAGDNVAGPGKNTLVLVPDATTVDSATFSVKVQSWLDFNDNNLIDGSEKSSAERTVTFVKPSEVTSTVSITDPIEGDTTAAVSFSLNDINQEQLTLVELGIQVSDANGVALAGIAGSDSVIDSLDAVTVANELAWDSTNKVFKGKSSAFTALGKTGSIGAKVVFENSNADNNATATTTALGALASKSVVARKIALFTATVVRSTTAKDDAANSGLVLRNSTFALKATATDSSTPAKKVAGSAVTVAITTDATLSATAGSVVSITVNGTTYTDAAKLPGATGIAKIATTTDANGVAQVSITTAGFAVNQHVTATFATENYSSAIKAVAADAAYTGYVENDPTAGGHVSILEGETVAFPVIVRDQFGGVPADGKYVARVLLNTADTGRTTDSTSAANVSAAVVSGKATVNLVDKGKGAGADTYDVVVSKLIAGGAFDDPSTDDVAGSGNVVDTVTVNAVANKTPGVVTVATNTSGAAAEKNTSSVYVVKGTGSLTTPQKFALELADFASFDSRTSIATQPSLDAGVAVAGTVTTLGASALKGVPVTITGAGLQFKATGVNAYGSGSLTILTGSSGDYSFDVSSNKAGKQTVTITSGSATQKVEIYFAAAAATTGTSLVLTAPTKAVAGRTLTVTGILTDKYGNVVDTDQNSANAAGATTLDSGDARFEFEYDGPGLVIGDLPLATDANGKFTVKVLLGSDETGLATFSATYGAANGEIATTDENSNADLTVSKSVLIGVSAAVSAGS